MPADDDPLNFLSLDEPLMMAVGDDGVAYAVVPQVHTLTVLGGPADGGTVDVTFYVRKDDPDHISRVCLPDCFYDNFPEAGGPNHDGRWHLVFDIQAGTATFTDEEDPHDS